MLVSTADLPFTASAIPTNFLIVDLTKEHTLELTKGAEE